MKKDEIVQMLTDRSTQNGETYEQRCIEDSDFDDLAIFLESKMKHEYEWLSAATSLQTSLVIGCDNSDAKQKELETHLSDLKELKNEIDSILDDCE